MSKYEYVNQPKHYQGQTLAVIDVIREFKLNFALGNVVKYALRAGRKPDESAVQDLEKALWYLQDELNERREAMVARENQQACLSLFAERESVGGWGEVLNPERDD